MKLSVQVRLIEAGRTIKDNVKWAKDHGVEGIELTAEPHEDLKRTAEAVLNVLPVSSICGMFDEQGQLVFDLLAPEVEKRRQAVELLKANLRLAGQVGAAGQVVPPMFGPPRVPDLSPMADPAKIQDELMVAHCRVLGPFAAKHNTKVLLEPLNRYEQSYMRTQEHGARIMRRAKVKGVALLSDLFHMHIEETDTPATLRAVAGKYTGSMHLADNTRMEPGTGDIDFVAAFRALAKVRYTGYMAYECAISGSSRKQRTRNLAKSLRYMRACIAKAKRAR